MSTQKVEWKPQTNENNKTVIKFDNPTLGEIIKGIGDQLSQDKVLVTSKYRTDNETDEVLDYDISFTFEAKPTEDGPWHFEDGKFNKGTVPQQSMSNSVKKKFTELEEKLDKVEAKRGIEYDHSNKTVSVFINPTEYLSEDEKENMFKSLVKKGIVTNKYVLLVF